MSQNFLALLEMIDANFDRIQKELRGFMFYADQDGEVEVVPSKESFFKRSNTLNRLIIEVFPNANILGSSASTLLSVWKDEIAKQGTSNLQLFRQIFPLLQRLLIAIYPNEGSLASRIIAWRKPLKEKYGAQSDVHVLSMEKLGIPRERVQARREEYTNAVREAVRERKTATFTEADVMRVIKDGSLSNDIAKNIVAVLLATGSRLIECLKVSEFLEEKGQPGLIRVVGTAKGRNTTPKVIVRPLVGLSATDVIDLVKHIRGAYDFSSLSNEKATMKVDASVNKAATEYFGEPITAHKLRYIWASLAYQKFGGNVPEQEWLREMLGHTSADTSLIYTQMTVQLSPVHHVPVDAPNVKFPQFMNPLYARIGKEGQLKLLEQLNDAYRGAGIRMLQRDAKQHRFGSAVVNEYWKRRYAQF